MFLRAAKAFKKRNPPLFRIPLYLKSPSISTSGLYGHWDPQSGTGRAPESGNMFYLEKYSFTARFISVCGL